MASKSGIPEHFIYKRVLNRAQQVLRRENTHCGHVFILFRHLSSNSRKSMATVLTAIYSPGIQAKL